MNIETATPEQRAAVESDAARILVMASPGSGKTRTVIWRIQRLINEGTDPASIVVITFTNAAANEVAHRLSKAGITAKLGYLGTLHGFCLREMQRHGASLGYGRKITVLDAEQADAMLYRVARELGLKLSEKKLQEAKAAFDRLTKPRTTIEIAIASYHKNLRSASAVDFDSILTEYLELLTRHTNRQPKIGHLIVDEYQDSGKADHAIYEALSAGNRYFIGDPDQAIYGFRGGRLQNILDLANSPEWQALTLEGNFRSAVEICKASNRLIRNNKKRVEKTTVPMRTEVGILHVKRAFESEEAEREGIADIIERMMADDFAPANPATMAIICRTNNLCWQIAQTLRARRIPLREKKTKQKPHDWRLARLSVELLNNPTNAMLAEQWLRLAKPDDFEAIARNAANQQETSLRRWIPGVATDTSPAELPQALARMGISRESIEMVILHRNAMPDPDLSAISYSMATNYEEQGTFTQGVTVGTFHSSKGQEFHTVFLAGCEQEIIPSNIKNNDLEESRRLFYVAMTRAKDLLIFTRARTRRQTWGLKEIAPANPSQFLNEL